jgi:hypothetical protein
MKLHGSARSSKEKLANQSKLLVGYCGMVALRIRSETEVP